MNSLSSKPTKAVAEFCRRYRLEPGTVLPPDADLIELAAQIQEFFSDALGRALRMNLLPAAEPAWALVRAMLLRGFGHADASFVCIATGSIATAEAVARATLECALNALYVLDQDRVARLHDYLVAHVTREWQELARWKNALVGMDVDEAVVHQHEIERRRLAIEQHALWTKEYARDAGVSREPRPWPPVADRFRAVGSEVDYRVLYAAMCSQVHNDAEDLLNHMGVRVLARAFPPETASAFVSRHSAECAFFARLLVLRSVEYLFRGIAQYGKSYGLLEVIELGGQGVTRARDLAAELCIVEHREQTRFGESLCPEE